MNNDYLVHYGVLGMKWGVRNYQNTDGSLTPEGRLRYGKSREAKRRIDSAIKENRKKSVFNRQYPSKEVLSRNVDLRDLVSDEDRKEFTRIADESRRLYNDLPNAIEQDKKKIFSKESTSQYMKECESALKSYGDFAKREGAEDLIIEEETRMFVSEHMPNTNSIIKKMESLNTDASYKAYAAGKNLMEEYASTPVKGLKGDGLNTYSLFVQSSILDSLVKDLGYIGTWDMVYEKDANARDEISLSLIDLRNQSKKIKNYAGNHPGFLDKPDKSLTKYEERLPDGTFVLKVKNS